MTIVLLVMALTASAQETKNGVTSGKMSAISSQKEISYSFSGGTVTRDDMQGSGDGGHYDYENNFEDDDDYSATVGGADSECAV